jgi:tRNA pseudouridine(54/55) synthase
VKECAKWVHGHYFRKSLGVSFFHESPFNIHMIFGVRTSDEDLAFEAAVDKSVNNSKKKKTSWKERQNAIKKAKMSGPLATQLSSTLVRFLPEVDASVFKAHGFCPPQPLIQKAAKQVMGGQDHTEQKDEHLVGTSNSTSTSTSTFSSPSSGLPDVAAADNADLKEADIADLSLLDRELRESYRGDPRDRDLLAPIKKRMMWSDHIVVEVHCAHRNVLVEGNYCKFSRLLSQTMWKVDDGEKDEQGEEEKEKDEEEEEGRSVAESSVEAEIARVLQTRFQAKHIKFHSSGREDLNVRMLGNGRPFLMELVDPHRVLPPDPTLFQRLNEEVNAATETVRVYNLALSNAKKLAKMSNEVGEKKKKYRCVVYCAKAVTKQSLQFLKEMKDVVVQQKTPIRVLFRRSSLTRTRTIYDMDVEWINSHWFHFDLVTQAGTYIKEFVHSDRGRTSPSLTELLGARCEIIQLDVTELIM